MYKNKQENGKWKGSIKRNNNRTSRGEEEERRKKNVFCLIYPLPLNALHRVMWDMMKVRYTEVKVENWAEKTKLIIKDWLHASKN